MQFITNRHPHTQHFSMFTEAEGNDVDLLRKLHIRPMIGHGLGQCNILLRFFFVCKHP